MKPSKNIVGMRISILIADARYELELLQASLESQPALNAERISLLTKAMDHLDQARSESEEL